MQPLSEGQQSSGRGNATDVRPVQEQVSIITPQWLNTNSISTLETYRLCSIRPISIGKDTKKNSIPPFFF